MKVKSQTRREGGASEANVTVIDVGEKVDAAIRSEAAKLAGKSRPGRSAPGRTGGFSRFAGSYRPGMYGGMRPWYNREGSPSLGGGLGKLLKLPPGMDRVFPGLTTGVLLGSAGNRLVVWAGANVFGITNRLLAEALGFGVGIIPLFATRAPAAIGIAIPGVVQLASAITEVGLEAMNFTRPAALRGSALHGAQQNPTARAREKLAQVQARIQQARQSGYPTTPRVVARPQAVGA